MTRARCLHHAKTAWRSRVLKTGHSYLKPVPKPGKDHGKLNGCRILIMQNKRMKRTVARKLTRDPEGLVISI